VACLVLNRATMSRRPAFDRPANSLFCVGLTLGLAFTAFAIPAHAQEAETVPGDVFRVPNAPVRSPEMIGGGSALLTVGLLSVPGSALTFLLLNPPAASGCISADACGPVREKEATATAISTAILVSGALSVAGGISMIVWGAQADPGAIDSPTVSLDLSPGFSSLRVDF
jgi:hypothetical protein